MTIQSLTVCTCYKVPKTDGSQGDDHKVKSLQRRPTLDVFKDGCWERHKQQAAEQHEQQSGYDPDLRLTDVPVLRGDREAQISDVRLMLLEI